MLEAIALLLASWLAASDGFHLGFTCNADMQCVSENSYCDLNLKICVCKPTHPLKLYNSLCVKVFRLGEHCELSASCGFVDEHSVCDIKRGCICKPGYREQRLGPHNRGKCVYKVKGTYDPYPYLQDSDEDDDDSHEDDDYDDRNKLGDITTPLIVGLVLGSLIVCGWSFAICRLYLKRVEKRQRRQARQKSLRYSSNRLSRTYESASFTGPPSIMSTQYALLDLSRDQPTESSEHRDDDEFLPSAPTPPVRESSLFPELSVAQSPSPPFISPDEEPLPAYITDTKKDGDHSEPPPSYDEVMKQSTV